MMLHRGNVLLVLSLLFIIDGCAIFQKNTSTPLIVDPLVERNREWREQVEIGNSELQRKNLRAALTAYETAVAMRPDSSEVQRKIAEIYFQLEEYENARDAFVAFLALEPKNITALNYAGYISEKLHDYTAASEYYERVLDISVDNLYALNHLGLAYKQLQRFDEAIEVLHTALSFDPRCERPESENLHNYLGLIYLELGEIGEAIAELRESARLFPSDIWAREQLAALFENQQRYFEAQLQYQQIVKVDPDNLLALTRLQALAQQNFGPTEVVDVPPVMLLNPNVEHIIANAPDASDYPDADTLVLFNHFSHDILPTGQSRYTTHQVVKILTERGIQKYGDIAIPYQPTAQNIGVNIARTITADGTVLHPPDEAFNDATPPGLLSQNLYSDAMWKVISMVGLAPGVCVEYQVTLEDKVPGGETWITGGYNFQATEATLETSYALQIPKAWHLQWKIANDTSNTNAQEPEVSYTENDTVVYIWRYGETPALTIEEGMPHVNDIVPRLRYSSIIGWNDVYMWYKELAKGRYTPDAKIEEKVQQLTQNLTTEEAKIRAIYHFVAANIRYVGIELGQSAYQPSPAAEVFQMQYGDCKDKTTLLISMLDLVGIKAYPVLISVAPYERVDTTLPALNQFNHMIAAIPTGANTYIWLDPTSATCSYGDLPYNTQGRTGFLISDTHGEFVKTPVFPSESNRLVSTTDMTLNSKGTVEGTLHIQTSGQYDLNTRWAYQQIQPRALKATLAAELSQQFPGIQIVWHEISDLNELNVPVEIRLGFRVENYATSLSNNILLPLPIDEFGEYAEAFANDQRIYSLDFGYPTQVEKTIRIQIPDGWSAALPEDSHHTMETAEFTRQYRQVENIVTYRLMFTLKDKILPAAAYPAAKLLFTSLASEDGSHLLLNMDSYSRMSRR
jgi:tetratricopeptide (TPR) repeat protein